MKNIYKIALLLTSLASPALLQGTIEEKFNKIQAMLVDEHITFDAIKNELTSDYQTREILTFHDANHQTTLLHWLIFSDKITLDVKVQLLDLFIKKGADINAQDINGLTPLFLAIDYNAKNALIKALLEHNADPNIKNNKDQTSFLLAIYKEWPIEGLALLLKHGADINTKDKNQWSPLSLAIQRNAPLQIIEFLLENGANPNYKQECIACLHNFAHDYHEDQLTPLFMAAQKENNDLIKLLLEYGADPEIPSHYINRDQTALEFYKEHLPSYEAPNQIDALFATKPNQEKIAAAKKRTPTKPLDPNNPNEASWSAASKVGISTLIIAAAFAGYYGYKKWQAKKKADQKKKEIQAKKEKFATSEQVVAAV
jgi:ankyrin repeat protein